MTGDQKERISILERDFGAKADDTTIYSGGPFGLPSDWIYVSVLSRGHSRVDFGISPAGEAHS
jgi:hypothetical protein